jgi:hypothetical protein
MHRQREDALKVLGIPAGSDWGTVTRAYRRLARETHPDVSGDPDAAERFATVTAAYRLLSGVPPAPPRPRSRAAHSEAGAASTDSVLGLFGPGRSWRRPPIVAGPVLVRRFPPDAADRDRDG